MLDAHQLLWTQIAAGVCLLIFGGLLFNMLRMRSRMEAASHWDKVEGVITVSSVDQPATHVSDDLNDATPVIRYRYRAGGQEIESDRVKNRRPARRRHACSPAAWWRDILWAHASMSISTRTIPKTRCWSRPRRQSRGADRFHDRVRLASPPILTAHSIAGHVLYTGNGAPLFVFPLPILALLGAVFSVIAFVRGRRLASASARWPTVTGTITTSDVIEEAIEDKSNDDKSFIRKIYRYQVDLRYAYQLGKRDFVGTVSQLGRDGDLRPSRNRGKSRGPVQRRAARHGLLRPGTAGQCGAGAGQPGRLVDAADRRCPVRRDRRPFSGVLPRG